VTYPRGQPPSAGGVVRAATAGDDLGAAASGVVLTLRKLATVM
jgi:hypothetical protein